MRWREITEKVIERVPSSFARGMHNIYLNGSRAEFKALMGNLIQEPSDDFEDGRPDAVMRALLDPLTGDLYFWDGFIATHWALKDRYHIPDAYHLILKPERPVVMRIWRGADDGFDREKVRDLMTSNPNLRRLYGPNFEIGGL